MCVLGSGPELSPCLFGVRSVVPLRAMRRGGLNPVYILWAVRGLWCLQRQQAASSHSDLVRCLVDFLGADKRTCSTVSSAATVHSESTPLAFHHCFMYTQTVLCQVP